MQERYGVSFATRTGHCAPPLGSTSIHCRHVYDCGKVHCEFQSRGNLSVTAVVDTLVKNKSSSGVLTEDGHP
jgi:hypothetical protein